MDRSQLDHLSRADLLEGFTALFAVCQYFCSPIIGDKDAHKLIIQALHDLCPALVSLGMFYIDRQLLAQIEPVGEVPALTPRCGA